ncbi:MAG: replication-associated recombination protein A [Erysipelotrichaceae bacterium]|nr:replication-associated recombination protein A [Erysipelotrichaceae bacterium]
MEPLAVKLRPKTLSQVIGQKHVVGQDGIFTKFVAKKRPLSTILYGPPGCGKTTCAIALANDLKIPYRIFNASTGNKKQMDMIIEEAKMSGSLFIIIDEIHRLNKDKQDNLLPHLESGLLIAVGCTTANPYHAINPAIRSRMHIIKFEPLTDGDIREGIEKAAKEAFEDEYRFEPEALDALVNLSGGDIRYSYNLFELAAINCEGTLITRKDIVSLVPRANSAYDRNDDNYYDTLSAFQKSIRGSDVNGALYYLAKLIEVGDFPSLERRLITIAYEDVGLGNIEACARTVTALQAAKTIGFPEGRIPLASAVIELALSPKSKSAEAAIDQALSSINSNTRAVPRYLRLTPVGLSEEEKYSYDLPNTWEYLQYLPDDLKNEQFYIPWITSNYEKQLADNYQRILNHGRTNDVVKLNRRFKKRP